MERAAGFWSYAHDDDAQDGGRISRLAEAVKREYSLITGEELALFVDHDVAWGDAWKERIDGALSATTFFIPVITPRYFQRDECRRELLTFAGHARSLGREELLLSIYYVSVPGLQDDRSTDDEAIGIVSAMQWEDWRELRLESEDSPSYRKKVNTLAERLAEISQTIRDRDATPPVPVAETTDDDAPGVIELVADAEEAFPRLIEVLEQLTDEMNAVGRLGQSWGPRLEKASARGAGAALFALRQCAAEFTPHAERIERLGKQYSSELLTIDPAVLSLFRLAEAQIWDREEALGLADAVHGMHRSSETSVAELKGLVRTVLDVATLSREIRSPLRRIEVGLRNVLDGQAVLDEWERLAVQIEAILADGEDAASA